MLSSYKFTDDRWPHIKHCRQRLSPITLAEDEAGRMILHSLLTAAAHVAQCMDMLNVTHGLTRNNASAKVLSRRRTELNWTVQFS